MVVTGTAAYVFVSVVLLLSGAATVRFDRGGAYSLLAGGLAAIGLVFLYVALQFAPVNKVVPIASVYPALTVLLAALVLHEHVTPIQAAGVCIIIVGAILVSI